MKGLLLVVVCGAVLVSPCLADGDKCSPAGTWWGQNFEFQQEYLITIVPIEKGRYAAVTEGINDFPPYEKSTAWRGELIKTGRDTFEWTQILYGAVPGADVPDIFASRGEIVLVDCDRFDATFEPGGVYAWGQVPFVDDPIVQFAESTASYFRMVVDDTDSDSDSDSDDD